MSATLSPDIIYAPATEVNRAPVEIASADITRKHEAAIKMTEGRDILNLFGFTLVTGEPARAAVVAQLQKLGLLPR